MTVFIEGDYLEIVDWLDSQGGCGINHSDSHGEVLVDENDEYEGSLNYGLFSLVRDHGKNNARISCCYQSEPGYVEWFHYERSVTEEEWMSQGRMFDSSIAEMEYQRQYAAF